MENSAINFYLGNKPVEIRFGDESGLTPTTTVLQYLRSLHGRKGTKEGCGQGDCGACTVVIARPGQGNRLQYEAINSCLLLLPMLDSRQLISIEDLAIGKELHPVQKAMYDEMASQCGFCTPGVVMSLFALSKERETPDEEMIIERLSGNLCRCTGYSPILKAAKKVLLQQYKDHFDESEEFMFQALKQMEQKSKLNEIRTGDQVYYKPVMLREALQIKEESPIAQIVAGATDLCIKITKHRQLIPEILDISCLEELQIHDLNVNGILLGSGINLNRAFLLLKKPFPELAKIIRRFGSYPIRNRATIGGNIATASPVGDLIPGLLAYNAQVLVENSNRRKKVRLEDFIRDYRRTFIHPDEIITAVLIPFPPERTKVWCRKLSKRSEVDISTVSCAFRICLSNDGRIDEVNLFYGGMSNMVKHARNAELFLHGKVLNSSIAKQTATLIYNEFAPLNDARSSEEGRRLMARNLFLEFWNEIYETGFPNT